MNKVQLKYYNKRIKMIHKLMKKMSDLYFIDNERRKKEIYSYKTQ